MNIQQFTAYADPCARAWDTLNGKFAHRLPDGFLLLLTVNR